MLFTAEVKNARKIDSLQPARALRERPIYVGSNWFDEIASLIAGFVGDHMTALIVDEDVAQLYKERVQLLTDTLPRVRTLLLKGGEQAKTLAVFAQLQDFMAEHQIHRDDYVISLGGGTIGDITGFCASSYCHGISWLNIPTTLTAQIDCSYGGYTAVNIGHYKNYSGSFYWPNVVFTDISFLQTLPAREFNGAIAEMARLALVCDDALFTRLCTACAPGVGAQGIRAQLLDFVTDTITAKACITTEDPYLHDLRVALRMGRTTSQALESASKLRLHHGEAVSIGLGFEAFLSHRLGLLPAADRKALVDVLENCMLPTVLPAELHDHEIVDCMRTEKHNRGRDISLVLPYALGQTLTDWPKAHVIMPPDELWAHLTAYRLERG